MKHGVNAIHSACVLCPHQDFKRTPEEEREWNPPPSQPGRPLMRCFTGSPHEDHIFRRVLGPMESGDPRTGAELRFVKRWGGCRRTARCRALGSTACVCPSSVRRRDWGMEEARDWKASRIEEVVAERVCDSLQAGPHRRLPHPGAGSPRPRGLGDVVAGPRFSLLSCWEPSLGVNDTQWVPALLAAAGHRESRDSGAPGPVHDSREAGPGARASPHSAANGRKRAGSSGSRTNR